MGKVVSRPASSGRNTQSRGGEGERKEPAKDGRCDAGRPYGQQGGGGVTGGVGFMMVLAQVLVPLSNQLWKPLCAPKGLKSSWGCPDGSFSSWGCTDAPQSPSQGAGELPALPDFPSSFTQAGSPADKSYQQ